MNKRSRGKVFSYLIFVSLCLSLFSQTFSIPVAGNSELFMARAVREPVRGRHAMVASQHELASQIGIDVLKKGGNAVDAAIAVGLALAVVYPEAGNIGGGGFMLYRRKDGQAFAIDYREMAPGRASRDLFVDKDGNLIKGEGSSTVVSP